MLPEDFKQSITSLSEVEIGQLYDKYCLETGSSDTENFILYLYRENHISYKELKIIEAKGKVELTSVATQLVSDDTTPQTAITAITSSGKTYDILESIDRGAMGEILIAKDNELGRMVAYKKIHQHVADTPGYLGRFFKEAQVTAQLEHPSIIPIYGFLREDNGVGYAMKLIEGRTLQQLIEDTRKQYDKQGKPDEHHSLPALLDHFLKICDAMHLAHRKGVIHRDLKPLNVMVGPFNEVYVMDWGIAKLISVNKETFGDMTEVLEFEANDKTDNDKTSQGQLLGTPVYMSPEQASGHNEDIDHRSDLYTLGLILFEIVTLRRALKGGNQFMVIEKAKRGELSPPEPYSTKQNIPSELIAIINKATALKPDDRYLTVNEFADDIRRYLRGEEIRARPDNLGQKIMRMMNRHRLATLNIMMLLILASVIVINWSIYQQQQLNMNVQIQAQKISSFLTKFGHKSQIIDNQFLKYEGILEGIAASAINLIEHGQPDAGTFYDYKDFAYPDRAPPDYAHSEIYGFPISVGWQSYKLAPGINIKDVENTVRKINPLRHTFKRLLLKSYNREIPLDDKELAKRIIKDEGLPLVWTYVGLENGIFAGYPGKTGYPPEYDARERPWYLATLTNTGTCWQQRYVDVHGRGVLLPCTTKLYDSNGLFLGVVGVELTLDYILSEIMSMMDVPGVRKMYLLNEKAEIVVASSDKLKSYERGTLINSIDNLELYPKVDVVNDILVEKSGYFNYTENNTEKILAYNRLNSIGWYYLVEADAINIQSVP